MHIESGLLWEASDHGRVYILNLVPTGEDVVVRVWSDS